MTSKGTWLLLVAVALLAFSMAVPAAQAAPTTIGLHFAVQDVSGPWPVAQDVSGPWPVAQDVSGPWPK